MMSLPNGCKCSNLAVIPKNWKSNLANTTKAWKIVYRFYDPNFPNPKQVKIMGMNNLKSVKERRAYTETLIQNELELLKEKCYNPITKYVSEKIESDYIIHPDTPFIKALYAALEKKKYTPKTKGQINLIIGGVKKAASQIGVVLRISEVRKKHIRLILDHLSITNKNWSANQFNTYRKYLSMLFRELSELEAVDYNPMRDIAKQNSTAKIRTQLSLDQRKTVGEHLKNNHYNFWRFMVIFFHSGARISELTRLKVSDVNLIEQEFKVTVLKGRGHAEKIKPIKTIAIELWTQLLDGANHSDYIFSRYLRPGSTQINSIQITRRWRTHVKKELGVNADFYSLKHSNLDETAAALSINDAAAMASHSTPIITMTYATGESKRQRDRLKEIQNAF